MENLVPPPSYEETMRQNSLPTEDCACAAATMPPAYTDVDLDTVTHHQIKTHTLGLIDVYVQGDWANRAGKVYFLTVHDVSDNHERFAEVAGSVEMKQVLMSSIWVHVQVPDDVESLTQLSRTLEAILDSLCVRNAVLIGEGAGANVVCQFAIETPNRCMGMILIDLDAGTPRATPYVLDKLLQLSDTSNRPRKGYDRAYNERDNQMLAIGNGLQSQTLLLYSKGSHSAEQTYELSRRQPHRVTGMHSPHYNPLSPQHRRDFLRAFVLFCKGCGFLMGVPLVGVRAKQ